MSLTRSRQTRVKQVLHDSSILVVSKAPITVEVHGHCILAAEDYGKSCLDMKQPHRSPFQQ